MRLLPPPLTIGDREGFDPAKDIFGRKLHAERLTHLLTTIADPLVIAVDGQWGSGKTTFLKMWAGDLRNRGLPVIYFDAFENDYADDAFTAIAGEIIGLAAERRKENESAAKRFFGTAVQAGKIVARSGLKIGVKAATMGALDAADLKSVASDISGEAAAFADKYLGEKLTQRKQEKNAIQSFRDALTELPQLLAEPAPEGKVEAAKPLVFIIDELDRCRPAFALEILDRVKHFFAVPGVHFVLGTHVAQLENAVALSYGSNIDAQRYLQKFIHLTHHLIDRQRHSHERTITKFLDYLIRAMEFPKDEHVSIAVDLIRHVAEHRTLSLRTIERVITVLAVALAFTAKNQFSPAAILSGLCIFKAADPPLFVKAKLGLLHFEEASPLLGLNLPAAGINQSRLDWITKWWAFALQNDPGQEVINEFGPIMANHDLERERVVPTVANDVIDSLRIGAN
jgi:hypothetical protein